jgi:hypothetical protein
MALASSPSCLAPRLASPAARPPSQLILPGAAARPPRRCSYLRFVTLSWKGRASAWWARALLGGFSDAGVSESDDDEDEQDAMREGGPQADEDAVELAEASSGPERWDVLGLGQAMVRASSSSSFRAPCNYLLANSK